MKSLPLLVTLAAAISGQSQQITLFQDDFESGNLDLWTGKVGLPPHGQIVSDPLNSGNHVLNFTQTAAAGDTFSAAVIDLSVQPQPLVLSFDFLALPIGGHVPTEYGGFAGITTLPAGIATHFWLGGTYFPAINVPEPVATVLATDGQWHHYDIDFTSVAISANLSNVQVMLEDWYDRGSTPGDIYFDNVRLTAGPDECSKDTEAPRVACRPAPNPGGKNAPAGKNPNASNPHGFFQLLAKDNCDPAPQLYIGDSASSFVAGPFAVGDVVKIEQATGAASQTSAPPGIVAHIHLNGDALLYAVDSAGNVSEHALCN